MVSYIWRSTDGQEDGTTKQGTRTAAGTDVITFSKTTVTDGKYLHQTQLDMIVGIGENEKPKGNVNELQDTFLDSITWTITGSVVTDTGSSSVFQKIKEWLIDEKTDDVFTKGRFGLELDDITSAQAAIRNDLGASVQESVKLSLSFARTSAATGQTSEDLAKTLSIMESISGASRDVLLNQIRTNAAMIEAAGVAPALVMKDIASNAEFFASFAKDGGQNIIAAGIAARKLGLDMNAVASATESLLDFESSIEKSMEASMLLGREINTDRARQLALAGDQKGMMEEIRRVAGGEAAFKEMNVLERRALAAAFGQSVEQLSRIVRNNRAAATGGAVGAAIGKPENLYSLHAQGYEGMTGELVRIRKTMEE